MNTTAFQSGPEQWREVASMEELRADARLAVRTDAVALLLTLDGGTVAAIEDHCTLRWSAARRRATRRLRRVPLARQPLRHRQRCGAARSGHHSAGRL
ncbi:MAG: hypothetical protein R2749_21135 [Acidimicrobiales bacterium]